jgi:hypothetical protein
MKGVPGVWAKRTFSASKPARRRRRIGRRPRNGSGFSTSGIYVVRARQGARKAAIRAATARPIFASGRRAGPARFCANCTRPGRAAGGEAERRELQPATLKDLDVTTQSSRGRSSPTPRVSPLGRPPLAPAPALPRASPKWRTASPRATGRARPSRSTFLVFRSLDPKSFPPQLAALPAGLSRHS